MSLSLLLIEDDPLDVILFKKQLDPQMEVKLEHAADISSAMSILSNETFDIIILDLSLPDSTIDESFSIINRVSGDIPIIVLTGLDDSRIALDLIQKGAQDYISKSDFSKTLLSQTIRYAIERKKIELKLFNSREEYRQLLDSLGDAILILVEGRIQYVNPAATILFNVSPREMIGSSLDQYLDHQENKEVQINSTNEKKIAEQIKVEMTWEDNKASLISLRDITDRVKLQENLKLLSLTDELTGLFNRRGMSFHLEQQMKNARRNATGFAILYTDINDFKQINDTYGHDEGDKALLDFASILKKVFRESDIIARIGGDEFSIFPIDIPATVVINRIKTEIENFNVSGKREYVISSSIGYSYFNPAQPASIQELLSEADKKMYIEKNKHHNLSPEGKQ